MADGFEELIDRSNAFFRELSANNTRDWFEDRKSTYTDDIKKPAEFLAEVLSEDLSRLTGTSMKSKLFRIHRDIRFSKDKTPYNTHLHMMWRPSGSETAPVFFFGSSPDYLSVGAGVAGLSGPRLARYRSAIDRDGDAIEDALETAREGVGATLTDWGAPPLKRVPKPYDPDHPHGELLKRKSLTVGSELPDDWRDRGLVPSVNACARGLLPVWIWLNDELG